jgi:hypothetical protein
LKSKTNKKTHSVKNMAKTQEKIKKLTKSKAYKVGPGK